MLRMALLCDGGAYRRVGHPSCRASRRPTPRWTLVGQPPRERPSACLCGDRARRVLQFRAGRRVVGARPSGVLTGAHHRRVRLHGSVHLAGRIGVTLERLQHPLAGTIAQPRVVAIPERRPRSELGRHLQHRTPWRRQLRPTHTTVEPPPCNTPDLGLNSGLFSLGLGSLEPSIHDDAADEGSDRDDQEGRGDRAG